MATVAYPPPSTTGQAGNITTAVTGDNQKFLATLAAEQVKTRHYSCID